MKRKTYTTFINYNDDATRQIKKDSYAVQDFTIDGVPFMHFEGDVYLISGDTAIIMSTAPIEHAKAATNVSKARILSHLRTIQHQLQGSRHQNKKVKAIMAAIDFLGV